MVYCHYAPDAVLSRDVGLPHWVLRHVADDLRDPLRIEQDGLLQLFDKELQPERRVTDRHFLSNDDDSRTDVPFDKFPEMLRQGFQVMAE